MVSVILLKDYYLEENLEKKIEENLASFVNFETEFLIEISIIE